jgi:hypothetical protein
MEGWKDGILGKNKKKIEKTDVPLVEWFSPNIPIFHYSTIPIF